jgi:hypothetical protein
MRNPLNPCSPLRQKYLSSAMLSIFRLFVFSFLTSTIAGFEIHDAKGPSQLQRYDAPVSTQFPIVYVAGGIVNCGSQLALDVCSTQSSVIRIPSSTTTEILSDTWTITVTVPLTQPVIITTVFQSLVNDTYLLEIPGRFVITETAIGMFSLTGTVVQSLSLPVSTTSFTTPRISAKTSYHPTVIPTTALSRRAAQDNKDLWPTPVYDAFSPSKRLELDLLKRSYDYDSCDGKPPTHDLVTNSLVEVCHFVANAQNYLVSLEPTTAAFMPSWSGFVIQVIVSIWNLFSIV